VNLLNKFSTKYILLIDTRWERFKTWFDNKLGWMLRHRAGIVWIVIVIFIVSIILAYFIPSQSTPEVDQQRFTLDIQLPKGSSLEAVTGFVNSLEEKILRFPEVEAIISRSGIVEEQSVASAMQTAYERAVLEVKIKEEGMTRSALDRTRDYINEIRKNKKDINVSLQRRQTTFEQILRPEPYDIKVMVSGKNLSTASNITDSLQSRLLNLKGIVDIRGGMQKGNPEYKITIDREKCALYDVQIPAISNIIQTLSKGSVVSEFTDFDKKVGILLKMDEDNKNISSILDYNIDAGKKKFPLREFLHWEQDAGFSEIWRENQNRVVMLTANIKDLSISKAVDKIKEEIKQIKKPEGYEITIGGENEEINDSFRRMFIILILSVILVYMLLAAEFESLKVPFVIILTSPLAFIGAIFAMLIFGESYNLMSMIGIVIMVGAVDNDAVIAIDFIIHLRKQGLSVNEAIHQGMTKRLRSIIMTTATTILGIIPLLLTTGESSSLAKSLSYPVVGGLFTATIFTLILIPIMYSYIEREKNVIS
jgi:HAE1 family hydrophobic/amphiphilic exporter-1